MPRIVSSLLFFCSDLRVNSENRLVDLVHVGSNVGQAIHSMHLVFEDHFLAMAGTGVTFIVGGVAFLVPHLATAALGTLGFGTLGPVAGKRLMHLRRTLLSN
jgi:hypothetical protein